MAESRRPRIFLETSRHLAVLLEAGIHASSDERHIPIYLCHPMEALEEIDGSTDEKVAGVLYLYRVMPDQRLRNNATYFGSGEERRPGGRVATRRPGFWARLRYAFLVVGGTLEDELGALAGVLRLLHEKPFIDLADLDESVLRESGDEIDALPLTLLDEALAWREIGLEEHRTAVVFEVSVPLPVVTGPYVEPILERDLRLEPAPPGDAPAARADAEKSRDESETSPGDAPASRLSRGRQPTTGGRSGR
ncbi:MAG: Pvc16 family protein [Planctomycetota bacterium]|nr:Pvc16 family protein [Planctomycetota bacterium]